MITREIINKNIKFHNVIFANNREPVITTFTYNDLSKLIDTYKNLLIANGARHGYSAVIGTPVCVVQTALFFACAELGVSISIVDYPHGKTSRPNTYVPGSISTKLEILLPITYLLSLGTDYTNNNSKTQTLMYVVRSTLIVDQFKVNDTPNNVIYATDSTILLRCTSSGSTGTPKVLEHTHEFLEKLIIRNSSMFSNTIGLVANLNHGSSPATYFLPSLASDKVTDIYHIVPPNLGGILLPKMNHNMVNAIKILEKKNIKINHVMFPYTGGIDSFLSTSNSFEYTTIYTLGIIKSEWVAKVKNKQIKDIISIFGSNETSGHILVNQASDSDFHENTYKKLDDFYGIEINAKNELEVTMPVYNKKITTGDAFTIKDGKFFHLGRSNLYRINDLEINLNTYLSVLKQHCNGDIILDENKNSIYVVIWDKLLDTSIVQTIDQMMKDDSQGLHYVSKFDCLRQEDFMTGVKVDKQLLREHFRNLA